MFGAILQHYKNGLGTTLNMVWNAMDVSTIQIYIEIWKSDIWHILFNGQFYTENKILLNLR